MPYYDQSGREIGYDPSGYGAPEAAGNPFADVPMPTLGAAVGRNKGVIGPGLKSGLYDIGGMLGAGVGALGGAVGYDAMRDWGIGVSDKMQQRSQAAGRPDLDAMPWRPEWDQQGKTMGDIPEWLAYQVAKQVPQVGLAIAGGKAIGKMPGVSALAAPLAEPAAALPEWAGGAALNAGMSAAEREAAMATGRGLAETAVGATIAGTPQSAGSMYQQEVERSRQPGEAPLSQGAAAASLAASPFYSALDAATPAELASVLGRGTSGKLFSRMAKVALAEGAQETVQEGLQTGMEMAFRPDLSMGQKAQQIVDSAIVGGLVGGVMGSTGGIRQLNKVNPASVTPEQLAPAVDAELGTPGQPLPPEQQTPAQKTPQELSADIKKLQGQAPDVDMLDQLAATLSANKLGKLPTSLKDLAADYGLIQGEKGSRKAVTPEEALDAMKAEVAAHEAHKAHVAGLAATFGPTIAPAPNKRAEALGPRIAALEELVAKRAGNAPAAPAAAPSMAPEATTAPPVEMPPAAAAPTVAPAPEVMTPPTAPSLAVAEAPVEESPAPAEYRAPETPTNVAPATEAKLSDTQFDHGQISDAALQQLLVKATGPIQRRVNQGQTEIFDNVSFQKGDNGLNVTIATEQGPVTLDGFRTVGEFMNAAKANMGLTDEGKARLEHLSSPETPAIMPTPRAQPTAATVAEAGANEAIAAQKKGAANAIPQSGSTQAVLGQNAPVSGEMAAAHPQGNVAAGTGPKPLQQEAARARNRKPKAAPEVAPAEKTTRGFNIAPIENSWPTPETKPLALAMVRGEMSPEEAIAAAQTALQDRAEGRGQEMRRFRDLANRYEQAMATNRTGAVQPKTAKERKVLEGVMATVASAGDNAVDTLTNLVQSEQKPKTAEDVIDAMKRFGLHLTKPEVEMFARSVGQSTLQPSKPTPKPMRQATAQTAADLEKGWAPWTKANDLARGRTATRNRAGNTGDVAANAENQRRKKIIEALEKGGSFHAMKSDGSGLKTVKFGGKPLPVLRVLNMDDAFRHLMHHSNGTAGNKALRMLSPIISRVGHVPVVIVPKADLQAAGADAAYHAYGDFIIMPNKGFTPDYMAQIFAHEAVHAAMVDRLRKDDVARSQLTLIAREAQKALMLDPELYAFTDPHEFLSEVMSDRWLQEQLDQAPMSDKLARAVGLEKGVTFLKGIFQKIADWIGWKGSPTFLDGVLRVAERLETKEQDVNFDIFDLVHSELGGEYAGNQDAMLGDRLKATRNKEIMAKATRTVVAGTDSRISQFNTQIDKAMNATFARGPSDVSQKLRQLELFWSSFGHIVQKFGKLFKPVSENLANPIIAYGDHMTQRAALTARMAQLYRNANDQLKGLMQKDKNTGRYMTELMANSTEFGLRPDLPLDKQSKHVKDYMAKSPENAKKIADIHAKLAADYKQLRRVEGVKDGQPGIYEKYRAINDMLIHSYNAVQLYNALRLDPYFLDTQPHASGRPSLSLAMRDPVEDFLKQSDLHEDPIKASDYWRKAIEGRVKQVRAYAAAVKGLKKSPEDTEAFDKSYTPIEEFLRAADESVRASDEATYFHLGRHGNYILRFEIPRAGSSDKDPVDPAKNAEVSRILAQQFPDVRISPQTDQPYVMARFESKDQRDKFRLAVKALEDRGLVIKNSTNVAQRDVVDKSLESMQPNWLRKYLSAIEANDTLAPKQKLAMISTARNLWLDQLNDTAIQRVLAERNFVSGYNADMLRNFAFRAEVGINALANLSITSKIRDVFNAMDDQLKADQFKDPDIYDKKFQVVKELQQRDADRPRTTGRSWLDDWRAINQAYFLGLSPAYTAVNMSQLGVMLLPELAKRHGFVNAAKTIAAVTPKAFKIISETFKDGKKLGWARAFDAIITENVLKNALPGKDNDEMRAFLTRMVNSGNIDLGSPMRELGRASEGVEDSKIDQMLRMTSAMGYYSETLTRVIAALSAHELAMADPKVKGADGKVDQTKVDRYASEILNEAMLNYSNWYTARATGKTGIMGEFTPVPASFQQYTLQVLQKMYRELGDAFSARQPDESDAEHKARVKGARRFLLGHATVIGVLAGSLGMPFATVALRAADWLRDLFGDDDEPHDTKTDYRNFLADILGKEAGEVMARGLPRALGFDVSSRVGEQDLLPFSRFIADRRKMEDASKDLVFRSLGSPVSMVAGVANGGWEMSQGNYLNGLQMIVPNSIKAIFKAGRMVEGGYEDASGVPLPIQADPQDIMWQALGFNPAEKAEYTEANMARATRKTLLQREASQMRGELVEGMEKGEVNPDAMQRAQAFDMKNPAFAVMPTLGSTIQRRRQQAAYAQMQGLPLGSNPADMAEQRYLGFANLR